MDTVNNGGTNKRINIVKCNFYATSDYKNINNICACCKHVLDTKCPTCKIKQEENIHVKCNCKIIIGKCMHAFHEHCIDQYIKSYVNICPVCSKPWEINTTPANILDELSDDEQIPKKKEKIKSKKSKRCAIVEEPENGVKISTSKIMQLTGSDDVNSTQNMMSIMKKMKQIDENGKLSEKNKIETTKIEEDDEI